MSKIRSLKDWTLHVGARLHIGKIVKLITRAEIKVLRNVDAVKLVTINKDEDTILVIDKFPYIVTHNKEGQIHVKPVTSRLMITKCRIIHDINERKNNQSRSSTGKRFQ